MAAAAADGAGDRGGGWVRRRTARAADDVKLKELGLRFFSTLVKNVDYSQDRMLEGPLRSISDVLVAMEPLKLFDDWSPPRDAPERAVSIPASAAFASSCNPDAGKALEATGTWKGDTGLADTHWGFKLDSPVPASSIAIEWAAPPEKFDIETMGESGDWNVVDTVEGTRVAKSRRFVLNGVPCAQFRLRMHGFGSKGSVTGTQHGIASVTLFEPDRTGVHVPTKKSLDDLQEWLQRSLAEAPERLRGHALRGLTGLALASGSLASLLRLSRQLLDGPDLPLPAETSDAATRFEAQLETVAGAEHTLQAKAEAEGTVSGGGSSFGEIPGVTFDNSSDGYASVSHSNSNMTVSSQGTGWAALTYGPLTSGKAAWEMRLDEDTTSQCSCFGAVQKPVTNTNYEYSPDMWMYRSYNGRHYQNGSGQESTRRIYKGDTVRVEVDMDEGTMRYIINGEDQGIAFKNLKGRSIWPACAFYSSSRKVTLLKFEGMRAGGGGKAAAEKLTLGTDITPASVSGLDKGVLGVGDQMGFDGIKLEVDGRTVSAGIGMVPPKFDPDLADAAGDGDEESAVQQYAQATFALDKKYAKFTGAVAINDSADSEKLAADGSGLTFTVLGDGVELWSSKPVRERRKPESFSISVLEVVTLSLRVRVDSSNAEAHAVWMEPAVEVVTDWTCNGWVNDRDTFDCAMWGVKRGDVTPLEPVRAPDGDDTASTTHKLAYAALGYAGVLANEYMRGMRAVKEPEDGFSAYDLESAFAVEASGETFSLLCDMLRSLYTRSGPLYEGATVGLLRIIKSNLRRVVVSRVGPAAVGLSSSSGAGAGESKDEGAAGESKDPDDFEKLKPLYELLTSIVDAPAGKVADSLRGEAVDALNTGALLFVPSADERKAIFSSQLTDSGVVEVQLSWPLQTGNADGDVVYLDRFMLLMQVTCRRNGLRYSIMGRWPSKVYLVVEVAGEGDGAMTLAKFLDTEIADALKIAGDASWTFPVGLTQPELPLMVERTPAWDRKGRLPFEPGVGCVRVYPSGSGTFEDVTAGVRRFLPKRHLVKG